MVLLPTGELREYQPRTTAAQALEGSNLAGDDAGWFICDADAMGFEGTAPAVGGAEELRAGQIYFVLPSEARRDGLRREDIAALAVKASAALVDRANAANAAAAAAASGGRCKRRRRARSVSPLVFAPPEADGNAAYKTVPAMVDRRRPVARVRSSGRMNPRFSPDLTAIPECETYE
jgi:hypothetical protein